MATLTVWKFEQADTAERAERLLEGMARQELIKIEDAAVVTWPEGKKSPKTRQLSSMTGTGALGGAFWGLLFGLIFFVPILGMAVGAAMGAATGSLADVGISDEFIARLRQQIQPGTSALFLLSREAVIERVGPEFEKLHPQLIESNLDPEDEQKLREVFSETHG